MAVFTATNSGQVLTGTDNADLFVLSAETSITVLGRAGADTVDLFSRGSNNHPAGVSFNKSFASLGGGPDLMIVSNDISASEVRMGAGADTLIVSGDIQSSKIFMGAGSDNLQVGNDIEDSTITMGAGADSLFVSGDIESSFVGMGAGADTIWVRDDIQDSMIELGGGADSLRVDGGVESSIINAGAGNDTLLLEDVEDSLIRLGGGSDNLTITERLDSSTVNGGAGGDTIVVEDGLDNSTVNGDGGNDSIHVFGNSRMPEARPYIELQCFKEKCFETNGQARTSTINGGAGADTIKYDSRNESNFEQEVVSRNSIEYNGHGGGSMQQEQAIVLAGGAGSDLIEFNASTGVIVKFEGTDSTINAFDTVGALQNVNFGETLSATFAVSGVVATRVSFASSLIGPQFNTNDQGLVTTWKGGVGATLADRVQALSEDLAPGKFAAFEAESNQYVFMAGNNPDSINDDLVVQLKDNTNFEAFSANGFGSIRVTFSVD